MKSSTFFLVAFLMMTLLSSCFFGRHGGRKRYYVPAPIVSTYKPR